MADRLIAHLEGDARAGFEELAVSMADPRIRYFPIRHHSPACAWQLRRLIETERPAAVLIEGPSDFQPLLPLLLDAACKPPVAFFTAFIDEQRRTAAPAIAHPDQAPPRYLAFYPFCDHSPELVALDWGTRIGATVRFIDLPFAEQILATSSVEAIGAQVQARSLLDEAHLQHSRYLGELARQAGCRDQDELWDHLFEVRYQSASHEQFRSDIAAYCLMGRQEYSQEALEADGTLARERAMAWAIAEEAHRLTGDQWLLVVTGGFHTPGLPPLVAQAKAPRKTSFKAGEQQSYLVRYSFDALDALNGYSAGMRSPAYYDQFWQDLQQDDVEPLLATAMRLMLEVGRVTRAAELRTAISTADALAAIEQSLRLATLRGHVGPAREDLLDGIRSCFIKGPMDVEGLLIFNHVRQVFTGHQVGEVPASANRPPIVADFDRKATALRLPMKDTLSHERRLDIYRKARDRDMSRFFHRLRFLGVSYATFDNGPDWVNGTGLSRLHEIWKLRWSAETEGSLIQNAIWGATVESASAAKLGRRIVELDATAQDRNTAAAVQLIVEACQMGLHQSLPELFTLVERHIAEDGSFLQLVEGLRLLQLVHFSFEPLEAQAIEVVPQLIELAYERACYLVPGLATIPEERANEALEGLRILRDLLTAKDSTLDAELCYGQLQRLVDQRDARPLLRGGAAGLLFSSGRLTEDDLRHMLTGSLLAATSDTETQFGFLRGVLECSREAIWQTEVFIDVLDSALQVWDESHFLTALPHLRLALTGLSPREITRVAAKVATYLGLASIDLRASQSLPAGELELGIAVTQQVLASLESDGLAAWGTGDIHALL